MKGHQPLTEGAPATYPDNASVLTERCDNVHPSEAGAEVEELVSVAAVAIVLLTATPRTHPPGCGGGTRPHIQVISRGQ